MGSPADSLGIHGWICRDCGSANRGPSLSVYCWGCGRSRRFGSGDRVDQAELRRKNNVAPPVGAFRVRIGDRLELDGERIVVFQAFSNEVFGSGKRVLLVRNEQGRREAIRPDLVNVFNLDAEELTPQKRSLLEMVAA